LRALILFVADLFHPVYGFAIESLHDGDVTHGRRCGSAMPMLHSGRNSDDVPLAQAKREVLPESGTGLSRRSPAEQD
jgi:hypothetical protein